MTAVAVGLVVGAAGMHAAWNVLLKGASEPLRLSQRAMFCGAAAFAPVTLALWMVGGRPGLPPAAWLLAALSALFELAYFVFLSRAYREGELSFVYPIARGTGPVIAVAGGLLLLRERVSALQLAGVAVLLAGVWLVRRPAPGGGPLGTAVLVGLCLGGYTLIDRAGVRLGPAWLYAWVVFALTAAALAGWSAARPRGPESPPSWPRSFGVGLLMTATYYAAILALALAPVTLVAPARESAIVLVSAWGVVRLRERQGATLKVAGAVGIMAGLVLLVVP